MAYRGVTPRYLDTGLWCIIAVDAFQFMGLAVGKTVYGLGCFYRHKQFMGLGCCGGAANQFVGLGYYLLLSKTVHGLGVQEITFVLWARG